MTLSELVDNANNVSSANRCVHPSVAAAMSTPRLRNCRITGPGTRTSPCHHQRRHDRHQLVGQPVGATPLR